MGLKCCSKCGAGKTRDAYSPDLRTRDGVQPQCKECRAAWMRARPPEVNREQSRRWRQANPDHDAAAQRRWREANVERQAAYLLQWRKNNPKRWAIYRANRRARINAAFIEPVDRAVVWEIHEGLCGVCGLPTSRDNFEVDHRIPLSKDGKHAYWNCQPTHRTCNRSKGNRTDRRQSCDESSAQ